MIVEQAAKHIFRAQALVAEAKQRLQEETNIDESYLGALDDAEVKIGQMSDLLAGIKLDS